MVAATTVNQLAVGVVQVCKQARSRYGQLRLGQPPDKAGPGLLAPGQVDRPVNGPGFDLSGPARPRSFPFLSCRLM